MHSRVAAVKAPCTHNRRRVTGSSGRRREGSESERQRSNMSRHVFTSAVLLLLFVMMICCDSGSAQTEVQRSSDPTSCRVASPEEFFVWRDKKDGETVSSLRVPSLVEVNGGLFAVAEAQCTGKNNCGFTGIASELLTLTDEKPKELDTSNLKTQVLGNCSSGGEKCPFQTAVLPGTQSVKKVHVSRPTTVVNGSDIYMLAGNYSWAYEAKEDSVFQWGPLLVKGNVNNEEGSGNRIQWKDTYDLPWISSSRERNFLTGLIGGGGSGIKTTGDTFLFPVEGTKEDGKAVSLIMYSSDTAGWTVSREMSDDGCSDPSVVEWKGKLIMMTACDDGRRRVYEIGDKGESWTEALGTLSRVWGNKDKGNEKGFRSGLTTAKIDNRDVMLVTLPVYPENKGKGNGKGELHLWLTDNTHIVDIGPVSGEGDDVAASSLLYKSGNQDNNKELIVLYEKKNKGDGEPSPGMVSVRLTAQLERVKEVLATWKKVDERVSKLCPNLSAEKDNPTGTACDVGKITDGLVGFLSGNFSGSTWRDEYLGVNATVTSGIGTGNGMTFTGYADGVTFRGAWAEWPVGAQGENQLYHFANYNFTLLATVSIHKAPEGDTPIPLMGVKKMNGGKSAVLLGLSYNKERKWELVHGGGSRNALSSDWEPDTTYQVAIVLQNGTQGSAYVDGQRVGNAPCELGNADPKGISHFYIGGDGGGAENTESREVVPVTVTNVLLYNRPLDGTEINALNANKVLISRLEERITAAEETLSKAVSKPFAQGAVSKSSGGPQQTGKESLMGSSGENGETAGGTYGQEEFQPRVRELNATAPSSKIGNLPQGDNSDGGTMREIRILLLLLLVLGLWELAAL
ncbi:trans-sialidase [Trypanosoma cruzi Dm28c]|uniref:Trans-sialidase n=2 Tax=Trypanosoma cruzi TaxID=5693 RepID=V5B8Z1_TRYCR|nr:trans-sialidase [Trypanosoma cruzi Dm28c]PBJ79362.1 trans-sialidase [Trypanosoma cruzi cruzi]PWU99421.1 putative trans-sialidase, Group V [Trypanosoma cruzi]